MSESRRVRRRRAMHFVFAAAFFCLAIVVVFGAVVRSLWLYPLNHLGQ